MGAKLSKKKKGYCLGAGKDGESTETTEVEQKETENQEGPKDAAEPRGEKTPTDQSHTNGLNEEQQGKTSEEVLSGEMTKDDSNKNQKPDIKSSIEQEKSEGKNQSKANEDHVGNKPTASEKVCEEKNEVSPSEDKPKIECEVKKTPKTEHDVKEMPKTDDVKEPKTDDVKEPLSVASDKPTQESKPDVEKEGASLKKFKEVVTEPSAPNLEEELVKLVSEPVTNVELEKIVKACAQVETVEHVSEKMTEHTQTKESEEPEKSEKLPEKTEPLASESITIEPVSAPVVEAAVPEVQCSIKIEVIEPEKIDLSEPVTVTEVESLEAAVAPVESVVPESTPAQELVDSTLLESVSDPVKPPPKEPEFVPGPESVSEPVKPPPKDPEFVPEPVSEPVKPPQKEPEFVPEPEPVPENVESALPEGVPEIKSLGVAVPEQPSLFADKDSVKSETAPELVPCPESEKISATKQDLAVLSEPLPPKANEVPDQTAEEHENQELLGCDQGTDTVLIQAAIETVITVQQSEISVEQNDGHEHPVIQNGPSKHSAEVKPISTEVVVKDNGEQKESTDENCETNSTGQEGHEVKEGYNSTKDRMEISNDKTASQDTSEIPEPTLHCYTEVIIEHHKTAAEEIRDDLKPSAPEILEKHGVGNGLPIKEEIKVHLENGSDKGLHEELHNGPLESHEIQVCNE